jgi:hypothetical protein
MQKEAIAVRAPAPFESEQRVHGGADRLRRFEAIAKRIAASPRMGRATSTASAY